MKDKPITKNGFARIRHAFLYSLNGLNIAIRNEAAFQQEVLLFIVLLVILCFLPISIVFKSILFFANTLFLIVELVNSAIESIVDMTSPEYHELAKRAKDLGSAAVFISLILAIVLWGNAIYVIFMDGH